MNHFNGEEEEEACWKAMGKKDLCYSVHKFQGVELAKKFEQMVLSDERFEVPAERHMGMVVFRMKGENEKTEKLLKKLNRSGQWNIFSYFIISW